jgi:cytochrome c553
MNRDRRTSTAIVATALLCAFAVATSTDVVAGAEPDRAALDFFESSIRPILIKHCYECHSTKDPDGGLALDSRDGVARGGDSGLALIPGKPNESRLIDAIRYKNPDLQMPPQNKLKPDEIAALEKWIALGAPDSRTEAPAVGAPAPTGMSIAEGREFWAFRPVAEVPDPKLHDSKRIYSAWVRTPIDAFIVDKLEAAGLSPAPQADKRTLIRRATFDLTGLPPSPAEIETFLADESPHAFSRVIERLLASPEYGVRWGRHWLDVARYADSNGLDENLAFGNAWRYRDYVVRSFNDDKPFDRFLIEQLAGDLLPDADRETQTATAFLALGAKVLAEPDRVKLQLDTIDEQLDTIGKAFLGMTFGCARCHDHKFDPVKQTDYYALAAIFKSTLTVDLSKGGAVKQWHEFSFADDIEQGRMKAINAAINEKKQAASTYKSTATAKLRDAAREQAVEYLAAAATFEAGMPLTEVAPIAEPLGLHPYVLHHCRQDLEFRRDEPLWAVWHRFAKAGDLVGLKKYYRQLFADAEAAMAAAKKADPKATKITEPKNSAPLLQAAYTAVRDDSGFVSVPTKPAQLFDEATLAEYNRLADIARIAESQAPDLPSAMGATDTKKIELEMPIHIRGSHHNLGKPVKRGFPEVMFVSNARPTLPTDQSGRLELARWLADAKHPLTARVFVNRVWRWHFGRGLVASTDNFGRLGDRPTHPELLDWLVHRFITSGWSTKDLHRLIMASSVYQTASVHPDDAQASLVDPENVLLRKFRMQRLEAEAIRDALLAVTGRLERTQGGKSIPLRNKQYVFDHTSIDHTKYDSLRRAIYLPIVRNNLYPLFEQFDFPDPTMPTGSRNSTTVAPQALLLLNSALVMESAGVWADALLKTSSNDADRIRRAYETAFGRPPSDTETKRAATFVAAAIAGERDTTEARRRAWAFFCQSLLATNEFIYVK